MERASPLKPPNGHKPIGMSYRSGKHLQFWWCLTEKTPLCLPWTWHTTRWHEKAEMAPKSNATCIDKIWTMLNMVMVQPLGWSPPHIRASRHYLHRILSVRITSSCDTPWQSFRSNQLTYHTYWKKKGSSEPWKWCNLQTQFPGLWILDNFLISQLQTTPMLQSP